jgi:hypothetical protein
LKAPSGFLSGPEHIFPDEATSEEQHVRGNYLPIPPELIYSPQATNGQPTGNRYNVRLEPFGQVLRRDIASPKHLQMQADQSAGRLLRVVRTCQLTLNPIRLSTTEGSANRIAEFSPDGHEQLVPRLDVYHRKVVLPNTGSGTSPALEDPPGSGLGTQLLKIRYLPAGHLPESSHSSL